MQSDLQKRLDELLVQKDGFISKVPNLQPHRAAAQAVNADTYYGDSARNYDAARCDTLRWAREMGAVAEFVRHGPVLDCPLGTGRFVGIYRDRGLAVAGVDISPDMLTQAKKKWPTLDARKGSIFDLPFEDGAFEVAVCIRMLDWLDPLQMVEAVASLRRVARTLVVSIRTGTEGIVSNWTHDLSRFYTTIDGLFIAGRTTTEQTEHYGLEEIFYLRPATWDDAVNQFWYHGRSPAHEMQRLANEWFKPFGLPDIGITPKTATVRAEYWTGEQMGRVLDAMAAFDDRYITDMLPIDTNCPATVLAVDGRYILLDGLRRFNLWRKQPGLHPVLVIWP